MPGYKGTIIVHGNRKIALESEEGDAAYAESVCATEELKFYQDNVDPADMTPLKKPTIEHDPLLKFKSADDTKLVDFVPGDSSKQFSINIDNLRVYKMMLNPAKCIFGVPAGKLLGFLVSKRGIEANPEKIKAITSLAKPACANDVQRLAGHIAALSWFISWLGEKAIPLYQMMKKTDTFVWSDAANTAFED